MTSPTDADRRAAYARYGLTCLPRWATPRNFDRPTYGAKVARIAAKLGTPLMPHQRYIVDVALEVDPLSGLPAYRHVGVTVPRQSGKTSIVLPVAVHRALAWQRQRIVYAAQSGTKAREKWEDEHVPLLEECAALRGKFRVRKANGREAIIWRATRSMHAITANTEKAGHGGTIDLPILDEYFAQVDYRLDQAFGPAMITRPRAQKWWLSTAGTSKAVPFNTARARGRAQVEAGEPTRGAFFEWSVERGADRGDPGVWLSCMPALCPTPPPCRCSPDWRHTVTMAAVQAELEEMEPVEFDRAYLNVTREDDELDADPNVPSIEAWSLLGDEHAACGDVVAIAVEITLKRDYACITAAGEGPEGLRRVVVLEHGPGTSWLMPRIVELHQQLRPVAWAVDERSPTTTLVQQMEQAGIPRQGKEAARGELWVPTVAQLTAACGQFADAVRQGTLVHLDQPELTAALAGARTRTIGDGAWAWGRRLGDGADISPLVSATLALAAYERFGHLAVDYDPLANIG